MFHKITGWVRKNKIKSLIYFFILFIGFEYFSLPGYSIERLVEVNPKFTALLGTDK